ncbi:MAG: hypothetical protein ACLRIS_10725 [Flavonifractor plautii]
MEVNEKGTEAAAATVVEVEDAAAPATTGSWCSTGPSATPW